MGKKEDIEEIMIRATREAEISTKDLNEIFNVGGLVAVYNLGLKAMWDYVEAHREELILDYEDKDLDEMIDEINI